MDTSNGDKMNTDNDLYSPPTDSFWEIGKYSRVVKRCEDGNKLASDLASMISERAELEKSFSKMLKSWSKKWSEYIVKSPEFGSTVSGWKALMSEADASAEVHQTVHDELQNVVIPSIKTWQKGKYIKSMMHIKATKDFDEEFKRAQKPWAKLYLKVDKYKREYHTATKSLKLAETQENNAKLDGSLTPDQRSKIQEKLERCRKDKESAKVKYTEALQELNRANPKYMDDMNEVFTRCQTFEQDRLVKFQEFLGATEKCVDISDRLQSPTFQQFAQTIKNCDADRDLSWWSDTYGATMKMNWPVFEEYSDAHRTIARRGKGEVERENPVVVTAIRTNNTNSLSSSDNRSSIGYVNQSPVAPVRSLQPTVYPTLNTTSSSNPFDDEDDNDNDNDKNTTPTTTRGPTSNGAHTSLPPYSNNGNSPTSYPASANPFLDDDENVDSIPSYQSPKSTGGSSLDSSAGMPVRALYDYEAQEQDELSFKQGDVFTKLEDEDDQGWCKGRVNGRVGLYPATYVEAL